MRPLFFLFISSPIDGKEGVNFVSSGDDMPVKYQQPSQILTEHIRSKLFMIQFLLSNSYQKEFVIEPQPFADSHSTFVLMDFGFKKNQFLQPY